MVNCPHIQLVANDLGRLQTCVDKSTSFQAIYLEHQLGGKISLVCIAPLLCFPRKQNPNQFQLLCNPASAACFHLELCIPKEVFFFQMETGLSLWILIQPRRNDKALQNNRIVYMQLHTGMKRSPLHLNLRCREKKHVFPPLDRQMYTVQGWLADPPLPHQWGKEMTLFTFVPEEWKYIAY